MTIPSNVHKASRRIGWSWLVSVAVFMTGCGSILPGTGPAPDLYNLTPKSTFPEDLPQIEQQLVIEEPLAAGGLDNFRIAIRPSPTELDYFNGVRWTERAPRMIQTLIVESFENSKAIVAVGRQAIGLRSDYSLKAELREFQVEYFNGPDAPSVRVRINAKLIRQPRQIIMGSRDFESVIPVPEPGMQAIVDTFDQALGSVLKNLVVWAVRSMAEPGQ